MPGETLSTPLMAEGGLDNSEEASLARTARGDREAFSHFVAATHPAAYRLALAICGNPADAEDVLQETYLAAFRSAASFRGESSARTWLLTIARHQAWRMGKRRMQSSVSAAVDDGNLEELGAAAGWGSKDPERMAVRAQDREILDRALSSLTQDYREILVLRDLEGHSGEAVAAMLGLSQPAMKSRLHRARLALAAALREGGFDG